MKRRILVLILAVAMIVSTIQPTDISAKTSGNMYGDVNGDGVIDLRDLLTLKKYLSEEKTDDIALKNADLNVDQHVDLKDFLVLKKYFAEWDVQLGGQLLTVSFYDGDRLIDMISCLQKRIIHWQNFLPRKKPTGIMPFWLGTIQTKNVLSHFIQKMQLQTT